MFLRSNKLGQLEFKLEKIIGIEKHAGKVRKQFYLKILHAPLELVVNILNKPFWLIF